MVRELLFARIKYFVFERLIVLTIQAAVGTDCLLTVRVFAFIVRPDEIVMRER